MPIPVGTLLFTCPAYEPFFLSSLASIGLLLGLRVTYKPHGSSPEGDSSLYGLVAKPTANNCYPSEARTRPFFHS